MKKIVGIFFTVACFAFASDMNAKHIKVIIASESPCKISAVSAAFEKTFTDDTFEFISRRTDSSIPEQPVGKASALKGAKNRLSSLPYELKATADYAVAMENYIKESEEGSWTDIGLIVVENVTTSSQEVFFSQATPVPSAFVEEAKNLSGPSGVSEGGFSVTVGTAINRLHPEVDFRDWHQEKIFGGNSRQNLLTEALYKGLNKKAISYLESYVIKIQDFPKKGIMFSNFLPISQDAKAFEVCIDLLYEYYKGKNIDKILGLESRGFILGAALAYKMGIGFIPARKPGKLPGEIYTVSYKKEYGTDTLVVSKDSIQENDRVLIVDDLIATGGSAKAAIELVTLAGGIPMEFVSLLEVKELKGRSHLNIPSFNLID